MKERERELITALITHWINHMGDHASEYRKWVGKMQEAVPEVTVEMLKAAENLDAAAGSLKKAKVCFDEEDRAGEADGNT